jgi:hypothetical protein
MIKSSDILEGAVLRGRALQNGISNNWYKYSRRPSVICSLAVRKAHSEVNGGPAQRGTR